MKRLNIVLPDDLEQDFKEEVFKRMGMKKGNMSKAIEEAIMLWISKKS
ncbi:MAG: hypothetical protein BME93_03445 [Methanosarcinales archaeon Met12]|nr:MAG: hypothetical protein BME93_03445 [Methanosarcinales archaeon Met12]